jgi:hypothetical protein
MQETVKSKHRFRAAVRMLLLLHTSEVCTKDVLVLRKVLKIYDRDGN